MGGWNPSGLVSSFNEHTVKRHKYQFEEVTLTVEVTMGVTELMFNCDRAEIPRDSLILTLLLTLDHQLIKTEPASSKLLQRCHSVTSI
ncbi:hypothetical protein J6590_092661 [Homalodisca vitripennis]|nr:hypothetical protein J6590_092661 [Homalodisca vitripennis]